MGRILQTTAIAVALYGAYLSNPDEPSFHFYIKRRTAQEPKSKDNFFERRVAQVIDRPNSTQRTDLKLFSVVKVPAARVYYVGYFGQWSLLSPRLYYIPPPPDSPFQSDDL